MIIIADSGGTSTSWAVIKEEEISFYDTCGYNAVHSPSGLLYDSIKNTPLAEEGEEADDVWFYGAGCASDAAIKRVKIQLKKAFPEAKLHVCSDMLGAAQALCGHKAGIACILGTGSNSCLYDGEKITANTPPLGYILGDEGSGAALGKRFLGLLLKGHLPEDVANKFFDRYPSFDRQTIIERVYRQPGANAFLGSMCMFVRSIINHPVINDMVIEEFRRFFRLNLKPYPGGRILPVHFTGSVAYHFSRQLRNAASAEGYTVGKIEPSPLNGLIEFLAN